MLPFVHVLDCTLDESFRHSGNNYDGHQKEYNYGYQA